MKHRVILVNKFYYRRGGDCVSVLNTERLLKEHGHDVAVFAMNHPDNLSSTWSRYWPEEVTFSGSVAEKAAAFRRLMGLDGVGAAFRRMVKEFRPDVVHLHNVHSYLSPVVGRIARSSGARVVWTLHDYKLICPAYTCLRDGSPCTECLTDRSKVLTRRCMKGALSASLTAYAESARWNRKTLERMTDRFICPSGFMASMMSLGGFSSDRLTVLPNFISPDSATTCEQRIASAGFTCEREPYICYVGRLAPEKGIGSLLAAASELPYEFRIAGTGPIENQLRQQYSHCRNIHFMGHLNEEQTAELLGNARLSVIASECFENNPLSVIESLCAGTPVACSRIGGIPELIDSDSGVLFTPGSKEDIKRTIHKAWGTAYDNRNIATRSLSRFSSRAHYHALMDIYGHCVR